MNAAEKKKSKTKTCHKWMEYFRAQCPYCRNAEFYEGEGSNGLMMFCKLCNKKFQLGRQR